MKKKTKKATTTATTENKALKITDVDLDNLDGLLEDARKNLVTCAGLFAIVQGADGSFIPGPEVAVEFNEAIAATELAIHAARGEIENLCDGTRDRRPRKHQPRSEV